MNNQLETEVKTLIKETESLEDALKYVDYIASDLDIPVETVIEELKRQYNEA